MAKGVYSCRGLESSNAGARAKVNQGISTGATAGIAVGAIAVVALLALVAFFFWRRRKRQNHHDAIETTPPYNRTSDHKDTTGFGSDQKNDYEMGYYSASAQNSHYEASSQNDLIQNNRNSEMGRPYSSGKPGPEGRHELFSAKDPPAAFELSAEREVGKPKRTRRADG